MPKRPSTTTAALALAASLAVPAMAQYPVQSDGNALDANPRLGSGGFNRPVAATARGYSAYENPYARGNFGQGFGGYSSLNNNIVTGNVTGGREFRDFDEYTDPRSFRDVTAGDEFDAFNRSASGVTTGGRLINYANTTQAFFGDSTVANPPGDFVRTPGTGGFVPSQAASGRTADLNTANDFGRGTSSQITEFNQPTGNVSPLVRLFEGGALDVQAGSDVANVGPQPGEVDVDRLLGSPEALVLGNRLTARGLNDSLADAGGRTLSPFTRLGRDARLETLTSDRLRLLGGELLRDEEGEVADASQIDLVLAGGQAANVAATADGGQAALDQIEEGVRPRDAVLRLADPAEQSAQYAQLERRLDRLKADPFARRLRPIEQPTAPDAVPSDLPGLPGDLPGLPGLPGVPGADEPDPLDVPVAPAGAVGPVGSGRIDSAAGAVSPVESVDPPVLVERFSAGMASPTLKAIIQDAEALLADGQFATAAARFEAAATLLPNQPLVQLATGNAQLAAGFYRRSSQTLRGAYERNPELAMARVSASDTIGDERVDELVADLERLVAEKPDSVDAVFLLAYLSYGSGDDVRTRRLLDVAADRSGGDPFFASLKRLWLPETMTPASPATRPAAESAAPSTRPAS